MELNPAANPFLRYDDLRFPAQGINPPGAASDPARNPDDGMLDFSAILVNVIAGFAQASHRYYQGKDFDPHLHFETPEGGVGNIVIRFEYRAANPKRDFPADYTVIDTILPIDNNALLHRVEGIGVIPGAGALISHGIKWRISRLGNSPQDTYAGIMKLLEFDIHELGNSGGSRTRVYK